MSFKKNTPVTGFMVGFVSRIDGTDVTTGTPVGYYTLDGGTQTAIGDVTPVHEGNGQWSFDLLAAEMNGDIVGLTFTHPSAITQHFTIKTDTVIVSDLNNLSAAEVNTEVDAALTDYDAPTNAELVARTLASAEYATATDLATVDTNVDAILVDTGTTIPASLTTIDSNVDLILVDTGTDIPARFDGIEGATFDTLTDSLEAIRDTGDASWITGAGGSAPTVSEIADAVWDETQAGHTTAGTFGEIATEISSILDDTGTAIPASLSTIDTNVDAILVDTSELQANQGNWITATDVNISTISADAITAASIAASALDGKGDWNIGKTGYALTQVFPANFENTVISLTGDVNSDVNKINGTTVLGTGTAQDLWRA